MLRVEVNFMVKSRRNSAQIGVEFRGETVFTGNKHKPTSHISVFKERCQYSSLDSQKPAISLRVFFHMRFLVLFALTNIQVLFRSWPFFKLDFDSLAYRARTGGTQSAARLRIGSHLLDGAECPPQRLWVGGRTMTIDGRK